MAEAKIDFNIILADTSRLENSFGAFMEQLKTAHEATERFDKQFKGSVEVIGRSFETLGKGFKLLDFDALAEGFEKVGKSVTEFNDTLRAANEIFTLLSGKSLVSVLKDIQELSKFYGMSTVATNSFSTALSSATGALRACGIATALAAAGFAGWKLGESIGQIKVMGMTINDWITITILKAMKMWEEFKLGFGFMDTDEFIKKMESLNKSIEEIQFSQRQLKSAVADGETDGGSGPSSQKTPEQQQAEQERQRLLEQRLIGSVNTANAAQADEKVAMWANLEKQYIAEVEEEYRTASRNIELTLDERLAALERTSSREEALMLERQTKEIDALRVRENALNSKIEVLEKVKAQTTEQNIELNELKAQRSALESQWENMVTQHESERQELTRKTEEKRLSLYRETQERIDEINKVAAEKAQADAKKKLDILSDELTAKTDLLSEKRESNERDFRKTDAAKRTERMRLMKEEVRLLEIQVEKLEELEKLQKDDGAKKQVNGSLKDARKRLSSAQGNQRKLQEQPDPNSLSDQMSKVMVKLQNEMKTLAENIAGMFEGIVNSAIDSTAQSISGLIKGTMTWGQALQNIGDSILNSIISSFAKMAAQWIVNQILMWTIGKMLGAASVAATAPMASASAAMWAGPALMASVASYGGAVGAGQTALTTGLMANQASAKAFSVAAAEGGLITGPGTGTSDSIPALLSNGEFVIPAKKVQQFGAGFFEGIRSGTLQSMGVGALSGGRGGVGNLTPKINVQSAQPKVVVVNSQEELMKVMKGSIGEEITVAHIAKNKLRLGMTS